MQNSGYSSITPEIYSLSEKCIENSNIDPQLYTIHQVKRGLRDIDGKGVLTGLTEISTINSTKLVDGKIVTNGGRVLGVTAKGADLKEARKNAYAATEWISFENKYMRHDIGKAIDEA